MATRNDLQIFFLCNPADAHGAALEEAFLDLLDREGCGRITPISDPGSITSDLLSRADVLVVFSRVEKLGKRSIEAIGEWVKAGGGVVGVHDAADSLSRERPWRELIGCRKVDQAPEGRIEVRPSMDHFITRRTAPFTVDDEVYFLEVDEERFTPILEIRRSGRTHPAAGLCQPGRGRTVCFALGRTRAALESEALMKLIARAVRWAGGAEEKPPVRCGVIGYGGSFNMGKTHADGIRASQGLEFVAACDVDSSRMEAARCDFPEIETFTSVAAMLKKKDLDLVVLVTPHNTHADLAEQALRAGKHVVVEKPMCLSTAEADRMIAAAEKSGVMLSVFHNRRWDGDYRSLLTVIDEGLIGDVFQIELFGGGYEHPGNWWRSEKAISGGCLFDWGAHFVDWVLNLVPSRVVGVSGNFIQGVWTEVTNEDHAVAQIRFANGTLATIEQSSIAAAPKDRWRVLGTHGSAVMRDYSVSGWKVSSRAGEVAWTGEVPFLPGDWGAYYRNVADHLLMGESLEVTAEEGRRVIDVIETAERSWKAGRELPPTGQ